MTDSNMRYMALGRCADTGKVLVFEHLNEEQGGNGKEKRSEKDKDMLDSKEDAINDKTLLIRKVRTKTFLRRLTSIRNRKSNVVHDSNENSHKMEIDTIPNNLSSSHKNFDSNRIKIIVEMNQECHKSSNTNDGNESHGGSESVSSVSMVPDLKHERSIHSSTWVNFDEEEMDPFSASTKKHERHDSHGTKSTTSSFDESILNMIASCLDNAETIANCNIKNIIDFNSEDSVVASYQSDEIDDDEKDDESDNDDSLSAP